MSQVVLCLLIYNFLCSFVLQSGYGDAGGMYGLQATGARGGDLFIRCICFRSLLISIYASYSSVDVNLSFLVFQLRFHRWVLLSYVKFVCNKSSSWGFYLIHAQYGKTWLSTGSSCSLLLFCLFLIVILFNCSQYSWSHALFICYLIFGSFSNIYWYNFLLYLSVVLGWACCIICFPFLLVCVCCNVA